MSLIYKPIVLVLNKVWFAIDVKTVAEAFCQMASDAATALDIDNQNITPTKWKDWLVLPVRPNDNFVLTIRGKVRIPTVIVLSKYSKIPKRQPRLCLRTVAERDSWKCQYSGKILTKGTATLDHVLPRSRGGKHCFENVVLADKIINHKKGNKLPNEVGLELLKIPKKVLSIPVNITIKNPGISDWELFLK